MHLNEIQISRLALSSRLALDRAASDTKPAPIRAHRRNDMPCFGMPERDPRRWQRCLDAVKADMLAAGWNKHAGKFWQVQKRRAMRLYAQEK